MTDTVWKSRRVRPHNPSLFLRLQNLEFVQTFITTLCFYIQPYLHNLSYPNLTFLYPNLALYIQTQMLDATLVVGIEGTV